MALTDNIVAYWKLDESSGNAGDSTGGGRTLTNNGSTSYAPSKINNGGSFDGSTTKYLSRAYDAGLNIGILGDFTVAGWFNTDVTGVFNLITGMGWNEATPSLSYNVGITNSNYLRFEWYNGGYQSVILNTVTISASTWYFFSVTRSGTTISISINAGTPVTTTGTLQSTTTGSFCIGVGGASTGGGTWDGLIDEIGVWSRALNGTELSQLYNAGAGFAYPFVRNQITFVGATASNLSSGSSPTTFNHSNTGDWLTVYVPSAGSTNGITAVTYNSIALTKLVSYSGLAGIDDVWYLKNPPIGTYSVSITFGVSTSIIYPIAMSHAGVEDIGGTVTTKTLGSPASSIGDNNLIPLFNDCWALAFCSYGNGSPVVQTAGTGATQRAAYAALGSNYGVYDSNGPVQKTNYFMSVNSNGSANLANLVTYALKPRITGKNFFPFV